MKTVGPVRAWLASLALLASACGAVPAAATPVQNASAGTALTPVRVLDPSTGGNRHADRDSASAGGPRPPATRGTNDDPGAEPRLIAPVGSYPDGPFGPGGLAAPDPEAAENEFAEPAAGAWLAVSAGRGHTCGLRADNTVGCWGRNDHGQSDPPGGTFIHLSAGGETTCGLRADNTVACWGRNDKGQADPLRGEFRSLSVAPSYSCGIRASHLVDCWGEHFIGSSYRPFGRFLSVAAGGVETCALKDDASLVCWGPYGSGHAGGPHASLTAGNMHVCVVRLLAGDDLKFTGGKTVNCSGIGTFPHGQGGRSRGPLHRH